MPPSAVTTPIPARNPAPFRRYVSVCYTTICDCGLRRGSRSRRDHANRCDIGASNALASLRASPRSSLMSASALAPPPGIVLAGAPRKISATFHQRAPMNGIRSTDALADGRTLPGPLRKWIVSPNGRALVNVRSAPASQRRCWCGHRATTLCGPRQPELPPFPGAYAAPMSHRLNCKHIYRGSPQRRSVALVGTGTVYGAGRQRTISAAPVDCRGPWREHHTGGQRHERTGERGDVIVPLA